MLHLALTLVLAVAPQDDKPPTPELVKATVERIEKAFSPKGMPEDRIGALRASADVPHPDVVKAVVVHLGAKDQAIWDAALESLRLMEHRTALDALHKELKRKSVRKDDVRMARVLRAVGFHGEERSIKILADKALESPTHHTIYARIYGLANIRKKASLAALMSLMQKTRRKQVETYMPQLRLGLMLLTGTDRGADPDAWLKWWGEQKKTFEIAPEPPRLPEELQVRWNNYWGLGMMYDRGKRREDRGDDPEK